MKTKIIVGILTLLVVATVFFAMKTSQQGEKLIAIESEMSNLQQENIELNNEIISDSSLSKISAQAPGLGLATPRTFVYMNRTGVAMR